MCVRPVHACSCRICQNQTDAATARYHHQVNLLLSRLNEPQRRWFVATLSQQPGSPSDASLSQITGLSEPTIRRGRRELGLEFGTVPSGRLRHKGAGRPAAEKKIPRSKPT